MKATVYLNKGSMIINRIIIVFILMIFSYNLRAQIEFQKGVILNNKINSSYQEGTTNILTITSNILESDSLNLIFILPVEKQKLEYQFGSGIKEVKDLIDANLINNNVVFIQPEFIRIPWYGNHPTDTTIWQERYLVNIINAVSSIYKSFSLNIYLLGFSKSGWGSVSILLNYPDLIDGIFIWDSPLSTKFNLNWGMEQVFGNEIYFETHYLLETRIFKTPSILKNKLIVIGGYDLFKKETQSFLKIMDSCKINYYYDQNLVFQHKWNKDWIYELLKQKQGITNAIIHAK
jgi:hypothetical protein